MTLIKRHDGKWWPESDVACHVQIYRQLAGLDMTLNHVHDFRACVQAGGNVGVWPERLADMFGTVITFEPDPDNFECLTRNLAEIPNIEPHNAALGNLDSRCAIDRIDERNCGAHQVQYGTGSTEVASIDSLNMPHCGLIQLDIEGAELEALRGAAETIERCRPIISVEIKGLGRRYGHSDGDLIAFLSGLGYTHVASPFKDMVFRPESRIG